METCACGETESIRKLDVPESWGVFYICRECDDAFDSLEVLE